MFKYYRFVRQLWISVFNTTFALFLNVALLPYRLFFLKSYKGSGVIHILGTGPSLKKDMQRFTECRLDTDSVLCVNHFASTDDYERIRPNTYLLADNAFFASTASAQVNEKCAKLIDSLVAKTQWKMNLIVPITKLKSPVIAKLESNRNITIYGLNNIPVTGGFIKYNAYLYYLRVATPLYQNVLNASVYMAVKAGFNRVNIWGADHNWLEDITVLSDNKAYTHDKHFYSDGSEKFAPMNIPNVHGFIECILRCLRAYHEIQIYAKLKHVAVINRSSTSWIDAFERDL